MSQFTPGATLVPSKPDIILLADAVGERLTQLASLHSRVTGCPVTPPSALLRDFELWGQLVTRHQSGDNRHTADEYFATRRIAQWTVTEKCRLVNQPLKIVEFSS